MTEVQPLTDILKKKKKKKRKKNNQRKNAYISAIHIHKDKITFEMKYLDKVHSFIQFHKKLTILTTND